MSFTASGLDTEGSSRGDPEGALESWKLVRFIRPLPALTPDELTAMEKLNPKSAAELPRDRDIDEFLERVGHSYTGYTEERRAVHK